MNDSPKSAGGQVAGKARAIGLTSALLVGMMGLTGADDPDPKALVQVKRHLAKIGEEMLGYRGEDGKKTLPWAIRDKAGKPLLSWRVAILPQLGETELYRKFKLDEPWDSPINKPLVEKMPAIFAPFGPGTNAAGSTFFQVLVGPGTLFDDKVGPGLRPIPDGADSTLLVIEAAEAVPWTKPSDLTYDPKGPLPRFGGYFKEGSLALFADGTVAFIRENIDEPTLRALISRDSAEMLVRRTLRDHVVPIRRR
jgi:Protein of unknown function (DUF1559)